MKRYALLIANSNYANSDFQSLKTPQNDIARLSEALADNSRDAFEVWTLLDKPKAVIDKSIVTALKKAGSDDFLLIYFSGHGCLGFNDELMLAADDADSNEPSSMIEFQWLAKHVGNDDCQRSLICLDCCYSGNGRFEVKSSDLLGKQLCDDLRQFGYKPAVEVKGAIVVDPHEAAPAINERFNGTGRYLITASSPFQPAKADISKGMGIFTRALVNAIVGQDRHAITPDPNNKKRHFVTVQGIYAYVRKALEDENAQQHPMLSVAEAQGNDMIVTEVHCPIEEPVDAQRRWTILTESRTSLIRGVTPSCILDNGFNFMDWNVAFEVVFARPLELCRGMPVTNLVDKLDNDDDLRISGKVDFASNPPPSFHKESVKFVSSKYGQLLFTKLASQIRGSSGERIGWLVHLNLSQQERHTPSLLWRDVKDAFEIEDNWTMYASVYDKVVAPYLESYSLFQDVADSVMDSTSILDIGCGTGNSTLAMHNAAPDAGITAIDANDAMLQSLHTKVQQRGDGCREKITLIKGDALYTVRDFVSRKHKFDACVVMHVLENADRGPDLLSAIFDVLEPGGRLFLTAIYPDTDIDAIFKVDIPDKLRDICEKDVSVAYSCAYTHARRYVKRPIPQIRQWLKGSGFEDIKMQLVCNRQIVAFNAVKPSG